MPRAYCPECASEVPVDADGLCHVGHSVDLAGAPLGDTAAAAGGDDADEPQPWVASVDPTTSGGHTPPPGDAPTATPDEGPWTPDDGPSVQDDAGDDLAAAAAAAVESLQAEDGDAVGPDPVEGAGQQVEAGWPETLPAEGETPGWTPPTNDPVAPPPVPAPAPADPPAPAAAEDDDLSGSDFDIDDLAAAVGDLDMDDDTPPAAPAAPAPATAGTTDADDSWEDDLGEPAADRPASAPAPTSGEPVDLSNFTAKSGKVDTGKAGGGKKGGLFRRR